jgi:predicted ArsR family transcriptional regulator
MTTKKRNEKMLSVKEAAAHIGVSPQAVRLWLKEGVMQGELKQSELGVPYWSISESTVLNFEKPKAGRPFKPDSELKTKRRPRKAN